MQRLDPKETLLLIVDVQERLASAMPTEAMDRLLANAGILLEAAKTLGVRVIVSEQYPKGLGPTVAALSDRLGALGTTPLPKISFDACGDPGIGAAIATAAAKSVVVVGMETHVCVFQTARALAARGSTTYVVADAVASRREENRVLGLSLCEQAGAIVAPTETIVFDWLREAGTDAFKTLSTLMK